MGGLDVVSAIVCASLLLLAASHKVISRNGLIRTLTQLGVSTVWARRLAHSAPFAETATAVALVTLHGRIAGVSLSFAVAVILAAAGARALRLEEPIHCACFSEAFGKSRLGVRQIAYAGLFLANGVLGLAGGFRWSWVDQAGVLAGAVLLAIAANALVLAGSVVELRQRRLSPESLP